MTEFELIAVAKNCGNRYTDCSECPLDETEDCLQHLAVQLAERLEESGNRLTEFRNTIVDRIGDILGWNDFNEMRLMDIVEIIDEALGEVDTE